MPPALAVCDSPAKVTVTFSPGLLQPQTGIGCWRCKTTWSENNLARRACPKASVWAAKKSRKTIRFMSKNNRGKNALPLLTIKRHYVPKLLNQHNIIEIEFLSCLSSLWIRTTICGNFLSAIRDQYLSAWIWSNSKHQLSHQFCWQSDNRMERCTYMVGWMAMLKRPELTASLQKYY